MEPLTEAEKKTIAIAALFAGDPFPFPNANLLLLIAKLAKRMYPGLGEKQEEGKACTVASSVDPYMIRPSL